MADDLAARVAAALDRADRMANTLTVFHEDLPTRHTRPYLAALLGEHAAAGASAELLAEVHHRLDRLAAEQERADRMAEMLESDGPYDPSDVLAEHHAARGRHG